jgi:hypothetical protein
VRIRHEAKDFRPYVWERSELTTTVAPAAASSSAIVRPMFRVAPVTTATRSRDPAFISAFLMGQSGAASMTTGSITTHEKYMHAAKG